VANVQQVGFGASSAGGATNTATVSLPNTGTVVLSAILLALSVKTSQGALSSVTDDKGNTYTNLGPSTAQGNYTAYFWGCQNATAGAKVLTLHFSGTTVTTYTGYAWEESGLATSGGLLDATAVPVGNAQSAVTSWTTNNMVGSSSPNLKLYGFVFSGTSTNQAFASSGTGWAASGAHQPNAGDGDDSFLQARSVSATGTYASTGTCTSGLALSIVAALKLQTGASPASPPLRKPTNVLLRM
jgi:hypothetical protein